MSAKRNSLSVTLVEGRQAVLARVDFPIVVLVLLVGTLGLGHAQPIPYVLVEGWGRLPAGMVWGEVMGAEIGPDGNIYVLHRCGSNTCVGRNDPPIVKLDPSGNLLERWGEGLFVWPHGFHLDREGFVWATDAAGEGEQGHQVFKFSPDGTLLMTLGQPGVTGLGPDTLNGPADVVVAPDGHIFVADGHNENARVVKYSREGKFLNAWGSPGTGPGEFNGLHAIAMDSRGRVFVGDRGNSRIQIFDQDGTFLDAWTQFGTPSGIFIDGDDTIYVADNGLVLTVPIDQQELRGKGGIRVGSATDGSVSGLIPNTASVPPAIEYALGPEGVGVDAAGAVYTAEVGLRTVRKYIKR